MDAIKIDPKLATIGTINIVLKSKLQFGWLLDDVYFEINRGLVEICCKSLSRKLNQNVILKDSSQVENLILDCYPFFHKSGRSVNGEDEWKVDFDILCPRWIREPLTPELIQKIVKKLVDKLEPNKDYPIEILNFLLK